MDSLNVKTLMWKLFFTSSETHVTLNLAQVAPNGFQYKSEEGATATFTVSPSNQAAMFGTLKTDDGRSFFLERCAGTWK